MDRIESLFEQLEQAQHARRLPPVNRWQPAAIGKIDIRIARDGTWYHEGRPILRQPLVTLFAGVLRREGDHYFLVTPAQKLAIEVEDVPFIGIQLTRAGEGAQQRLLLSTNVGDHVLIAREHPLLMRERNGQLVPYVNVRDGLAARLLPSIYYELVELGEPRGNLWVVRSAAMDHSLGSLEAGELEADELEADS